MKIALIGYGKMGHIIEEVALKRGHEVVCKIDVNNQNDFDSDLFASADVAIEFTSPSTAYNNCLKAFERNKKVVSGSTGWFENHKEEMEKCCKEDGKTLFWASNFSIGVALFSALNKRLAQLMNGFPQYDCVIEEQHHTEKKDAPSGTAITLAEGIIENLDRKDSWVKGIFCTEEGMKNDDFTPKDNELIIDSFRIGDEKGTHTVTYECEDDFISITHKAYSRNGFALGAVLAAEYVQSHEGLLGINDLMNL